MKQSQNAGSPERRQGEHMTANEQLLIEENDKLRMQLQFKEESVDTLKQANEQYREKCVTLENEIQVLGARMEQTFLQMQAKDDEIEQLYLGKLGKAPTTFKLEISQLR